MWVTALGHVEAPVAAADDGVEPAATAASTAIRARRNLDAAATWLRIQASSRDMRPLRRQTGTRAWSSSSSPGRMGRRTITYVSTPCLRSACRPSRERTAKTPRRTSVEVPRLRACVTCLGANPSGGPWLSASVREPASSLRRIAETAWRRETGRAGMACVVAKLRHDAQKSGDRYISLRKISFHAVRPGPGVVHDSRE
jgi:hypothetical protein